MEKARLYAREEDKIRCLVCPRRCLLAEGQEGFCGVRRVEEGELYTGIYGLCAAVNWDPIEKKPLYHFFPGRPILSLGTYGCNLACSFCQNWSLARAQAGGGGAGRGYRLTPAAVLAMLQREGPPREVLGVAYTYNEPSVWYEFVYDTASLLHEHGYRNVLVTNGYISRQALDSLLPFIDAMNIDVKGFSDEFYRRYCQGQRRPVLRSVERAAAAGVHVEVTTLLIPTLNDSREELAALVSWLASISPELPLHFSRYFPQYHLDLPPTPPETLAAAREIALEKLKYVYLGNVAASDASHTRCPRCRYLLIRRLGYDTRVEGMEGNRCRRCGQIIKGVFTADPG